MHFDTHSPSERSNRAFLVAFWPGCSRDNRSVAFFTGFVLWKCGRLLLQPPFKLWSFFLTLRAVHVIVLGPTTYRSGLIVMLPMSLRQASQGARASFSEFAEGRWESVHSWRAINGILQRGKALMARRPNRYRSKQTYSNGLYTRV